MSRRLLRLLGATAWLCVGCAAEQGAAPPPGVATLALSPDPARIRIGESRQMEGVARSAEGTAISGVIVSWMAVDTSVATVSSAGVLTGRRPGTTTVIGIADGVTGRAVVEVTGTAGVMIVAGANIADTIGATLSEPLVVAIHDADGRPVRGAEVIFRGSIDVFTTVEAIAVARVGSLAFLPGAVDTTDAYGRAAVRARFRRRAGPVAVEVAVPSLGLSDSARYTIRPGAPTQIQLVPADTGVYAGATVTVRAVVHDVWMNERTDTARLSVSGGVVTLTGAQVRGERFGRAAIVADHAGLTGVGYVNVVPQGTIAFHSRGFSGRQAAIYMTGLDGSGMAMVQRNQRQIVNSPMPMTWLSATRLAYHDLSSSSSQEIYVHDVTTGASTRLLSPADRFAIEYQPTTSQDRAWIYFSGGGSLGGLRLYRVRPDGTGRELISRSQSLPHWSASTSPDGSQIVYVAGGLPDGVPLLEVMDLGTGVVRPLTWGIHPRWSPDGARVAFIQPFFQTASFSGPIHLMNADGTGHLELAVGGFSDIDWSPDGRYLLASTGGSAVAVIDVHTGIIAYSTFSQPTMAVTGARWKP